MCTFFFNNKDDKKTKRNQKYYRERRFSQTYALYFIACEYNNSLYFNINVHAATRPNQNRTVFVFFF